MKIVHKIKNIETKLSQLGIHINFEYQLVWLKTFIMYAFYEKSLQTIITY